MRKRRMLMWIGVTSLAGLVLVSCGDPGSSGTGSSGTASVSSVTCEAQPDEELVVLTDDRKLQTVDNVVPAINGKVAAANPSLVSDLTLLSGDTLTTDKLIELNRAVDVDHQTPSAVAKDFLKEADIKLATTNSEPIPVVVGAGNFSESEIIANIYAQLLNQAGYDASVQMIGTRELYEPALESGELTVVPEYAGTLTEFLNKKTNGADAAPVATSDLDKTMGSLRELAKTNNLVVAEPSDAADQNAFATTRAFADKYSVNTLSELSEKCSGITLAGPPECPERAFCQPGLEETYGMTFSSFQALDTGGPLVKSALRKGDVQLGLVLSSDGTLSTQE